MCGILGWVGKESVSPEAFHRCQQGLAALANRGPDGSRLEKGGDWVLGHTRLAILDLTDRAAQPMRDEAGRWIVFNGEIYNFKELRAELEGHGLRFESSGDTEVLLKALGHWGLDALTRLRGMFAFGWLDPARRELILARDRYGVKPLVWEKSSSGLRFASDLFALDAMAGGGREVDAEAARDYLMLGYVPTPRCIWRGPRKIRPGNFLRVRWQDGGGVEVEEHSYWKLAVAPRGGAGDGDRVDEEFAGRVREAVRLRLISDVPVGLLLSGGVDSSLVAAACAEMPDADVPSYTMGFADDASDERPFARRIASHLGLKHEEFLAEETDIAALFEDVWRGFDEPFADSSALPMMILCREIRKRVKVAVGGDGGDEVWCGYPWHRALARVENGFKWPWSLRRLAGWASGFAGTKWREQGNVFAAKDRLAAWATMKTGLTTESARHLPIAAEHISPRDLFVEAAAQVGDVADPVDWACRMDLATYLPDDLMVKADRASMRSGLELREPLLDHEFTRWGLGLPLAARFNAGKRQGKQAARRYLAQRLPREMVERPKQGFTPPLPVWLNGPLKGWRARALAELAEGNLHPLVLPGGCRSWEDCAAKLPDTHNQFLWRVVCFAGWKAARAPVMKATTPC